MDIIKDKYICGVAVMYNAILFHSSLASIFSITTQLSYLVWYYMLQ